MLGESHSPLCCAALGTALPPVQMSCWSAGLVVQGAASAHLQVASANLAAML